MAHSNLEVTLCRNLKRLRKTSNMTQEQIAGRLFISRSAYAAYESGSMLPNVLLLKKIADLHNMKIDDLLSQYSTLETP